MCGTALALPWLWQPIGWEEAWLLAMLSVTGAASQTAIIMAFTRTPASDLAPFTYSEIVSAVIFGALVFGTWPDVLSWIGITLIVASGVGVARAMAMRNVPKRVPKL